MEYCKIRIVSDGKIVRVMDQDGRILHGVQSIRWEATAEDQIPRTTIVMYGLPIDAEEMAEVQVELFPRPIKVRKKKK